MSGAAGEHALPDTIPVFPLPNVLLLPGGELPLNVFEPRYLAMTLDSFAAGRIIGIVQTREHHIGPVPNDAALYDIGCAGRITGFSETPDRRFLITLSGHRRFRIQGEAPGRHGYRRMTVDYGPYTADAAGDADVPEPARAELMVAVKRFFAARGIASDLDKIDQAPAAPLITSLAMEGPFGAVEKQAILEARSAGDRAVLLARLLAMASEIPDPWTSDARH